MPTPSRYLTRAMMSTMHLSLYWKHGVELRPIADVVPKYFSVDPVLPTATARAAAHGRPVPGKTCLVLRICGSQRRRPSRRQPRPDSAHTGQPYRRARRSSHVICRTFRHETAKNLTIAPLSPDVLHSKWGHRAYRSLGLRRPTPDAVLNTALGTVAPYGYGNYCLT